ncbi:Spo0B domain-containing protein [Sporosarcina pasteurii]|uniref:SpoOB alpha-helical domain-containing protein n=1 Tax=Sporosarcina pasteurii TaxID=1474 RepID=A0A380BUY7_SPOPA|nr:Spo0B domain-containing protein [Sporosarcina pasteurii]MDS9471317.1 Spo0B domain-containing protein [Sporosarcina pasteurii]QBQ05054.1 hypothetical protein E2C16_04930 [Sporosarcina pasteurii]SUJ07510.1 Uncharacterised protein [Sporosarcina pasteurii]
MKEEQLTIAQALKFTRHDFLNDLQIILMNIDLGNTERAKKTILATTNKMKQHALLSSLSLPKTEIWLATFEWIHTSFDKLLTCHVKAPITNVSDDDLVSSLQKLIKQVENVLDPFSEYEAHFDILSVKEEWVIKLSVTGKLPKLEAKCSEDKNFTIEEQFKENLWTFTVRGR